ncbi:MAG: zinc ribbon domain-containing protein [Nanoarchaeota archaeon]
MSSNRDLRGQMDDPKVQEAFGFLLSGKKGYKPVMERRVEVKRCPSCNIFLKDEVKFCPECGMKLGVPTPSTN